MGQSELHVSSDGPLQHEEGIRLPWLRHAALEWPTRHGLPPAFIIYFGSFGAMLSGMSTQALQAVSVSILCLSAVLLGRRARRTNAVVALLAIVCAQFVAFLASPSTPDSTSQIVVWLALLAVYWLSTAVDVQTLDRSLFAILLAVALIALYQALNHWLLVDLFSLPPRLGSTLWNANNLAFVMLLGLALAAKHQRWFWLVVFAAVLVLTGSLTSLFATAAGSIAYFLLGAAKPKQLRKYAPLIVPAVLLFVVFVALEVFQRQYRDLEFGSMAQRMRLWQVAATMFLERPLVGMGPGSFKETFFQAGLLEPSLTHQHAHNLYLHVAAETGILGLVALAGSIVTAVLAVRIAWRRNKSSSAALAWALLIALVLHGMLDYVYWIPSVVLLLLWTGRVLLEQPAPERLSNVFSPKALRANALIAQVVLIGMVMFRFTAERDFLNNSLARWTSALSLLLSFLLLLVFRGAVRKNYPDHDSTSSAQ